jgi:hypothetical protein
MVKLTLACCTAAVQDFTMSSTVEPLAIALNPKCEQRLPKVVLKQVLIKTSLQIQKNIHPFIVQWWWWLVSFLAEGS